MPKWKTHPAATTRCLQHACQVPTQAVEYTLTDPTGNARLAAGPLDAPLQPDAQNDFTTPREDAYPFTTLQLNSVPRRSASSWGF